MLCYQNIIIASASFGMAMSQVGDNSFDADTPQAEFLLPPAFMLDNLRSLKQTWDFVNHIMPNLDSHSDQLFMKPNVFIKNHGCYCFSSDTKLAAPRNGYSGPALDELDELCLKLYRAQKCLHLEESTEEKECVLDRKYPYEKVSNNEVVCGKPNLTGKKLDKWTAKNQCAIKNCELEYEFALAVKDLIEVQKYQQTNKKISNISNGRYNSMCVQPRSSSKVDDFQCCGNGISRRPFDYENKKCCNEVVSPWGEC